MRHSLVFMAVFAALDSTITFNILSISGVEFNPKVLWLISIDPILYPLADITLIATA